jgi:glycolate oxidase FAD binding subunit
MNSQNSEADKKWQVAVWCEGQPENVTRHLFDAETLAQRLGLATATLRDRAHGELWDSVRDFPLGAERCAYRATLPRAEVVGFIDALSQTRESVAAIIIDTVMGTVWLSWPATSQAATVWPELIALAAAHRGHLVMFAAPQQFKDERDVWGPPPAAHSLMRKIKQQFDPDGLLNPGRFIGGI